MLNIIHKLNTVASRKIIITIGNNNIQLFFISSLITKTIDPKQHPVDNQNRKMPLGPFN